MTADDLLKLRDVLPGIGEGWWPAEGPFEVAVGAILVQGVAWPNAQRAVAGLRSLGLLEAGALAAAPQEQVAGAIRPALYFQQKAGYLQGFARFVARELAGRIEALRDRPPPEQRHLLLGLRGIGPETASAIMVYALGAAEPVVDAYALRILRRVGAIAPGDGRAVAAASLDRAIGGLPARARLLHAVIVELGRQFCRSAPRCGSCPLAASCPRLLGETAPRRWRHGQDTGSRGAQGEGGNATRAPAAPHQGAGGAGARALG